MTPTCIPAQVDYRAILDELNAWGVRDYKIEAICGFAIGHVAQLRCGSTKDMKYPNAARLYNFWVCEWHLRASRGTLSSQTLAETTT